MENGTQEILKNYIVGLDLGRNYAQISYVSFEGDEGDVYNIPVCLCKRTGANQWFHGEEAKKAAANFQGTLVDDLLSLALKGEPVQIEHASADPVELLALFIRNCLAGLGLYNHQIAVKALVISVDTLSERMLEILNHIKKSVLNDFEHVFFEPKMECLFSYTIHQPKELRCYELGVIDLADGYLKFYHIRMNNKMRPIVTTIDEHEDPAFCIPEDFHSIVEKDEYLHMMDEKLTGIMEEFLNNRLVTVFYLAGKIFEKEWCPQTLKLICHNRRVFGGSNLYSKGACLLGMEKLSPGKEAQEYLYLGKDKLSADIGVAVMQGGKTVVHNLLNGGEKWFEVKKEFEFMPGEDGKLPIVITPLADKRQRIVPVILPAIVNRDIKSIKFRCLLRMKSANELVVEVEDAGLGEFFAPTNKRYREIISLV